MAGRRSILPRPEPRPQPDLSLAIVNIVLLLILFFMVTGSFTAPRGTEVTLAETEDLNIDSLPQPILLVNADGSLTLNDQPVAESLLAAQLEGETVLHILIDRQDSAAALLDLLSLEGLEGLDMRLVTVHRRGGS